jgi:hypothetical protein
MPALNTPKFHPVSGPYRALWCATRRKCAVTLLLSAAACVALAQTPLTLPFADFYQQPQGPQGPQMSEALRRADGTAVRLVGYMVQKEVPTLGRFMLSPRPVQMSDHADGDADDLPLALATVYLDPEQKDWVVPYTRGLIALTGRLELGRMEESDGRVSWVRLHLPAQATRGMSTLELASYFHSLQHRH